MSEEYQSGSYHSYNSRNPYSALSTKAKHTQNKYQKVAGSLVVFLILLGIATLVLTIVSAVNAGTLSNIEFEYNNYMSMISRANNNPDYKTTAEITGRYYDSEYNAYYLEYEIDYHFFFDPIPGVSPATFTLEELNDKYHVGDIIEVALSDKFENISRFTDSIMMDIGTKHLTDFMSYEKTSDTREITRTLAYMTASAAIVLTIIIIALYIKGNKVKQKETATSTAKIGTNNPADNYICEYCGTHMGLKSKCPACGATKKRN